MVPEIVQLSGQLPGFLLPCSVPVPCEEHRDVKDITSVHKQHLQQAAPEVCGQREVSRFVIKCSKIV